MADGDSRRRRSSSRAAAERDEQQPEQAAAAHESADAEGTEQAAPPQAVQPAPPVGAAGVPEGVGGTPAVPPPPPLPAGVEADDVPETDETTPWDKTTLIAHAPQALGVSVAVARGLLAEMPDEVSIGDARDRIQGFLDNPVQITDEPEEA